MIDWFRWQHSIASLKERNLSYLVKGAKTLRFWSEGREFQHDHCVQTSHWSLEQKVTRLWDDLVANQQTEGRSISYMRKAPVLEEIHYHWQSTWPMNWENVIPFCLFISSREKNPSIKLLDFFEDFSSTCRSQWQIKHWWSWGNCTDASVRNIGFANWYLLMRSSLGDYWLKRNRYVRYERGDKCPATPPREWNQFPVGGRGEWHRKDGRESYTSRLSNEQRSFELSQKSLYSSWQSSSHWSASLLLFIVVQISRFVFLSNKYICLTGWWNRREITVCPSFPASRQSLRQTSEIW
jgi:hypothetical protein